jgi:RimJ/RimL family protein N-acetyltransferase
MISIKPMQRKYAEVIVSWCYPDIYSMYDLTKEAIPALLDTQNRYFAVSDASGDLIGFCCFGKEGTVPGGRYEEDQPGTLDVGLGMSPKKIGRGLGSEFIKAILQYALDTYAPTKFRAAIAEFNVRSQRAFLRQGFKEVARFNRATDGMAFIQFERQATNY